MTLPVAVAAARYPRRALPLRAELLQQRLGLETQVLQRLRRERGWARAALEKLGVGWDGERLTLLLSDHDGKPHDIVRYSPWQKGKRKYELVHGRSKIPWPAPETATPRPGWPLVIVEGWGTKISLASIGVEAVALPGSDWRKMEGMRMQGAGWHRTWVRRFSRFDRFCVIPDADDPGKLLMQAVAWDLERAGAKVGYCDLGLPQGWDIGDLLRPCCCLQERTVARDLLGSAVQSALVQPESLGDAAGLLRHYSETLQTRL